MTLKLVTVTSRKNKSKSSAWCRNLVIQTIYVILEILTYFSVLPIRQKQAKRFKLLHRQDWRLLIWPFLFWARQILPVLFQRKWHIVVFWSWFMIIKVCPIYYKVTYIHDWLLLNRKINVLLTFLRENKKQKTTIENILKGLCWNLPSNLVTHLFLMYLFLWSKHKMLNISENLSKLWELPSHLGNSVNTPRS